MDISQLIRQSERLRLDIAQESDPALQREMRKTFNHYQKQIRAASKHRNPWFGIKRNLAFFVVLFLCVIWASIRLQIWASTQLRTDFGWGPVVTALFVASMVLVLASAMVFLVVRIISPNTYKEIVTVCINAIGKLQTKQSDQSEDTSGLPTARKPKQLPKSSTGSPVPIILDQSSASAAKTSEQDLEN